MIGPMWLLLWLVQAPPPPQPVTLPVRLEIPEGYIQTHLQDRAETIFVRRFAVAPGGEIRLTTSLLPGPIAEGMPPPHVLLRPAQLPPEADETPVRRTWQGLEIYAAEHAYDSPEGRLFAVTAALPLRDRALVLRLTAPEARAPEAREDMARLLEKTRGLAGWQTPLRKKHERQSTWALIVGGVLLAAYLPCWAAFFRGQPMKAHELRTAWLFAAGGGLFVPALLGVNLLWTLPAIFVFSMAVRRVKLALEL